MKRVLVAYSGGVDSTFLLAIAAESLGKENVLAATALSATTARQEQADAYRFAAWLDVEHVTLQADELDNHEFAENKPDKCYICKKSRYQSLLSLAHAKGYHGVVDGENANDSADYRPGSLAARELGIRSPLMEAGLTKTEIRDLSRERGLPSWNKPALACLASRIPYYQKITAEKLRQVDEGETFLRQCGFSPQLRLRHHGDLARIELDENDFHHLLASDLRTKVVQFMRTLGFQFVTLDLEGYGMGRLNRGLDERSKTGTTQKSTERT